MRAPCGLAIKGLSWPSLCPRPLWSRHSGLKTLGTPAQLHPRLRHQLGGDGSVLLGVLRIAALKLCRQLLRIGGSQLGQAADAMPQQQLTAFAANAAHLTEVSLGGGLLIAELLPAAEGAFLAIAHQWRRI